MRAQMLIEPADLMAGHGGVVFDCRFSLADPAQGRLLFAEGHIPGAYHLDLNDDLSGPLAAHGGRHPLPDAGQFAARLAAFGVTPVTEVIAYDDSRLGFAARLWWLMSSLGYRPPRLLNGGYQAFLDAGGEVASDVAVPVACRTPTGLAFSDFFDINGTRRAQAEGALLVDSREERRYRGLEEPIDPVAGHIPGAINRPWQGVTDQQGRVVNTDALREHWGDALAAERLVVYCGSGVTACVNLFSLALLGREDVALYAGSWSDWCSHL